jgi:hypothetical protein
MQIGEDVSIRLHLPSSMDWTIPNRGTTSRQTLKPAQHLIQRIPRSFSPWVKCLEREAAS